MSFEVLYKPISLINFILALRLLGAAATKGERRTYEQASGKLLLQGKEAICSSIVTAS
jgi:hypothetical protein